MRGALEPRTVRCGRGGLNGHLCVPHEIRHGGIAQLWVAAENLRPPASCAMTADLPRRDRRSIGRSHPRGASAGSHPPPVNSSRGQASASRPRSTARSASCSRSWWVASVRMSMTSWRGTGRPPARPPSPQIAAGVPSDFSSATATHHMRSRRSPVPPGERGTVGSWTTRRAPPLRSAAQVAVPGLGRRDRCAQPSGQRGIARDFCGNAPEHALLNEVHIRDVGDRLQRKRTEHLQSRRRGRRRAATEGHRHGGAAPVGPRGDAQRVRHRAHHGQPVADPRRVPPQPDPGPLVDHFHDKSLAVDMAADADLPALRPS